MAHFSRRMMLAISGASSISLGLGSGVKGALAQSGLAIPGGPMHLSRRLERGLGDGARIVVDRSWQVEFARHGRGIAIRGEQISAKVDAPAKLAAIAEIEETRSTADMWPILLSEEGLIVATGDYTRKEDVAAAVRSARSILADREQGAEALALHETYLAQLQKAGQTLLDQLPPDLFYPAGDARQTVEPVALPGGVTGEFALFYSSEKSLAGGWLAKASRKIVTRIGDDKRTSVDEWMMAAI